MTRPLLWICWALALGTMPASAGTACSTRALTPVEMSRAADAALVAREALEQADAPLALISRVGSDVSDYGLKYSHIALVVRDHHAGRWTVVHLLNRCGTDRSGLYDEGLVNFFADDLVNMDMRLTWLRPALTDRLIRNLHDRALLLVHEAHYNVIARYDSDDYQNSTGWILDVLMAAQLDGAVDRGRAQSLAHAQGFEPDVLRIAYAKRLAGGLFAANASFTDHPVSARLSGRYPVVTVRAILRHLERQGQIRAEREWRGGSERAQPGPA